MPLCQLDQFGKAASNTDMLNRMFAQVFQHAANKITHIKDRFVGQIVIGANGGLRRFAGGTRNVGAARGAGDIDAAMDRMDPCRTAKRDDNAGCAKY